MSLSPHHLLPCHVSMLNEDRFRKGCFLGADQLIHFKRPDRSCGSKPPTWQVKLHDVGAPGFDPSPNLRDEWKRCFGAGADSARSTLCPSLLHKPIRVRSSRGTAPGRMLHSICGSASVNLYLRYVSMLKCLKTNNERHEQV